MPRIFLGGQLSIPSTGSIVGKRVFPAFSDSFFLPLTFFPYQKTRFGGLRVQHGWLHKEPLINYLHPTSPSMPVFHFFSSNTKPKIENKSNTFCIFWKNNFSLTSGYARGCLGGSTVRNQK